MKDKTMTEYIGKLPELLKKFDYDLTVTDEKVTLRHDGKIINAFIIEGEGDINECYTYCLGFYDALYITKGLK